MKIRSSSFTPAAVALGAGAVAVLVLVEVTENVLQEGSTPFDHSVMLWLHRFDSPTTNILMRMFSFLGSVPVIISVVALVAVWAFRRRARALAGVLVVVASVAEGLNALLKAVVQRPRPDFFFEIVAPMSFSFPSGHAMVATTAYGLSAFVVARLRPSLRTPLYILTPVLVLLIGLSRVFLGVHWPTDVLAGFAGGGLVLVIGKLALGRVNNRPQPAGDP